MESSFLLACIRLMTYKGAKMVPVQAALLHLALKGQDFTARDLPGEITQGSKHIAGAATGALIAQGLLVVVGRVKSPDPLAKGRKLDVLRLGQGMRGTALAWLRANDLPAPETARQLELIA